jgi:hypothetical protein
MTGVLEDFIDRATLMADFKCTARTISRYENRPDGLPSVIIAGRKLYRKSAVMEWVKKQEKKPNQRRSG